MSQSLHTDNTQQFPELGYNTATVYSKVGWRGVCNSRLHSVLFKDRASRQKKKHKKKEYIYPGGKCEGQGYASPVT